MIRNFLKISILGIVLSCTAMQAREVTGRVLTVSGEPVSKVVVSDGFLTALTDEEGRFRLDADAHSRYVFISTPSGYLSSVRPDGDRTCFYQELTDAGEYDFYLKKNSKDDRKHQIMVIADPQVMDQEDLKLFDGRVMQMKEHIDRLPDQYVFGICLGDIVGWDHSLYPDYQKILDKAGLDFRHVIGNHDMTLYGPVHETSMKKYCDFFGPAWYSFNVGEVHYVVLNDNFYIGRDWFYIGYFDDVQLKWLARDLSHVSKGKKIVVCTHIPTTLSEQDRKAFDYKTAADVVSNKNALYSLLSPYDAVILSGHIHTCTTQNISRNLTEVNVGGFCGAWWCGDVCIDGAPAGYKYVQADGTDLEWKYVGCGLPEKKQMKVYVNAPGHPDQVIVNVWDYDDKWKVEYFENGRKVCNMERFTTQDPHALDLFRDPSKYKISWVYAAQNANFFRAPLSSAAKRIEVRVTDRFGRIYVEKIKM